MTTEATKTQAKKTTAAAKKTAQAAKKTTRQTQRTTRQAERTLRNLVSDSAYAALGVGDTAVAALRSVPTEVERVRKDVPKTVESRVKDVEERVRTLWTETPEELQARLKAARTSAEKEFDSYAKRGRSVVRSVRSSQATSRAVDQLKVARSQVKAAATSVRKAFGESVEAVESAADKVGEEERAS